MLNRLPALAAAQPPLAGCALQNTSPAAPAPHEAAAREPGLLLDVKGLRTWFHTRDGIVKAVDGVDLQLSPGEILGLVGESGSGKSITGFSLMRLVDHPGRIQAEYMRFNGKDLAALSDRDYRRLRGRELAMIFQDPMMTLNPTLRVDTQMIEAVQAHSKVARKAARARAVEVLGMVGIPSPAERLLVYPHHLSGGMRQRVAIAIALLNGPRLVIADEPTTALDVTIQGQILYEVQKLCRETGTALIWITHDLAVVSGLADRLAVMYAGRIVETGPASQVIGAARHPYTHGLIASIPSIGTRGQALFQIPGATPSLLDLPPGCPFQARCYRASADCVRDPALEEVEPGHWVSCWHQGLNEDAQPCVHEPAPERAGEGGGSVEAAP
jgi:peptide/nickel transport system ATP-binding protein